MRKHNQKSDRHFRCRDMLWEVFEEMSADLACSVDYLINDAMRQYARSRGYLDRTGSNRSTGPEPMSPSVQDSLTPMRASHRGAPAPARPRTSTGPESANRPTGFAPPRPQRRAPASGGLARPARPSPARPQLSAPPPYPSRSPRAARPSQAAGPLTIVFQGQRYPIQSEEFVIGRGVRTSDLAIRDGNVSRRHAAVVYQDGAYFIKDLGSTNGVEFEGERIETKRIEDGDVVHICDYELLFTFNP